MFSFNQACYLLARRPGEIGPGYFPCKRFKVNITFNFSVAPILMLTNRLKLQFQQSRYDNGNIVSRNMTTHKIIMFNFT